MQVQTNFGYSLEVHPRSYMAECLQSGGYEAGESQLIRSLVHQGDGCIDAGAHIGYFSRLMCEAGGKVLAIEPNPRHLELLQANLAGRDAIVLPVALSDVDSEAASFYLPSEHDDGWGSLCSSDQGQTEPIFVQTQRLDTILKTVGWNGRIRFLKMDIEGAEVPALRGLGERLCDVDYIVIECVDLENRVLVLGSTVAGINEILQEWSVRECADRSIEVPKAVNNGTNFLFVNPAGVEE